VLGLAEHPGELPGYGPVPASIARAMATDATWLRWVTDPTTGTLLDAGRRTYRPSAALREFIKARDVYCRFPTCSARADWITTEIDHADPYNHANPDTGGQTTRQNLGPVCRKHHAIKTAGLWSITDSQPDGTCDWLSPTGHRYPHHPEHLDERFDDDIGSFESNDGTALPNGLFPDMAEDGWSEEPAFEAQWQTEPPDPNDPDDHPELTELERKLQYVLCA
jgi:hypothetical protein